MNDELVANTDWLPVAAAAWHRATRDTGAGRAGGDVLLQKDGRTLVATRNDKYRGESWPDGREPDMNDLAAAMQLLARAAGVDVKALAESMTNLGLPTTRARLDSIRARKREDQSKTSPAELIVMCYAAVGDIKRRES